MHKYTVDFTVSGHNLDESEVSGILGLKASVFLKEGEPLSPQRERQASTWSLHFDPSEGLPQWQTLEAGLRCLTEKLSPLKDALERLRQRYSLDAYCGHFGSGFGGGPSISPDTLRKLADLGLSLTIKSYWGSNEPD